MAGRRLKWAGLDAQQRTSSFIRGNSPKHLTFHDQALLLQITEKDKLVLQGKVIPTRVRRRWMRQLGLIDRWGRITPYARALYEVSQLNLDRTHVRSRSAESIRRAIARAVAANRPYMSERSRRHWREQRERYLQNALRAVAKGRQVLAERNFEPLRGVPKSGAMAAGPENYHADDYRFLAPDGRRYIGRNVSDFVREHADLFGDRDLRWKNGSCNASKSLSALRPWYSRPIMQWKGWRWLK